jgi:hypothetical protein
MTAALDLHPEPGHPVAVVAAVHEALDGLGPVDDAGGVGGLVVECERAVRRLEALRLRLLSLADSSRVAATTGHASTGAWLASRTNGAPARCARDVRLAADLGSGMRATGRALDDGAVSTEHATVIAEATRRLPDSLSPSQVDRVEERLVEKAKTLDPVRLRRVARRALEAVERDSAKVDAHEESLVRDEEQRALDRTRLTLHDNGDGTISGHFTVPLLAGSILQKAIHALTAPRRAGLGASSAQAGDPERRRDPAHRAGLALVELLEHLPTDRLHGKVAATVVVTLDLETLRERLRAAGLDTGDLVSASEARRLACQAGLVPAVLGGRSQPLDLGRSSRLFTEAQRTALATCHATCAADGCERPYAWCELHHRRPWGPGGRTDLSEAVPLCGFHHRRIHDPAYDHRTRPDGGVVFHRRT